MRLKKHLTIEDFEQMCRLEAKYYDESHITPVEEAYKWYLKFPDYNAVLEANDESPSDGDRQLPKREPQPSKSSKIIGFLDMFPINEDLFRQLKAGIYNDANLTAEDIVDTSTLANGDVMHMFLCCVVVDEEYRKQGALSLLFREMIGYFESVRNRGIEIDYIITDNVTSAGANFSRRLGFEKVTDTQYDSVIYMKEYSEFLRAINEKYGVEYIEKMQGI